MIPSFVLAHRISKISTNTSVSFAAVLFCVVSNVSAQGRYVSDEILVKPKSNMSEQAVQTLFKVHGAKEVNSVPQIDVRVLRVPAAARNRVMEALQHNPNIEFAEPNGIAATSALTNDPYVTNGYEWHLSKIQASQAWNITTGNAGTIVAIVDTGVAANHPDLIGKVLSGYNFYANNTDTADDNGHGTAVAGTAVAWGNNGVGVAGVAWNASILPVKISDPTGYATYSNMANALTYAVDHGSRIINISFYGSTSSSTLQSAANYVWSHNGVIFACAGNAGSSTPQYPAACNTVIAVSNTNSSDIISTSSSYGSFISLSAPGTGIWTTNRDGSYGAWSGTSFSSPVAAGVAALLVANDPQITNARIVDILKQNSDDLGAAGYDIFFGYGRVNAYRALLAAGAVTTDTLAPTTSVASPTAGNTVSGAVNVQVNASDAVGVTKVELYLDSVLAATSNQAPAIFSWDTLGVANGTHTICSLAYDAAGNVGNSGNVSVSVLNSMAVTSDSTAPTAQITSPTDGTVIGRSLKVYTTTTDNIGVVRVELYRDGAFAASSTASSSVFSLNTGKWAKGAHTLQVLAYDTAGNAGASATVSVTK